MTFHRESEELLGVHIIGEGAAELIHIGQAVLALKGTIQGTSSIRCSTIQRWRSATRPQRSTV